VILQKIEAACGGSVTGRRLAVLGLTFKADTDDVRESPSIELIRALSQRGAKVRAYDPSQPAEAARLLPDVRMTTTVLGAVKSADAVLVLTDWKDFLECDLGELAAYMSDPVMVDMRNLFDEKTVLDSGFRHYARLGRKPAAPRPRKVASRAIRLPLGPVAQGPLNEHGEKRPAPAITVRAAAA
jgi:UDPglucose 6-dehydrogenase